jgi:hypothetical protein
MATKLYDVAVKTGSYTDKNGEEKGRYENVGSVWKGDNGEYMVMKRTFNPAGVPFKDGSDSIFLSLFVPREDGQQQQPQRQQAKPGKSKSDFSDMDDSAPF